MQPNLYAFKSDSKSSCSPYFSLIPDLYLYQDLYLRIKPPEPCYAKLSGICVGRPLFRPLIKRSGARFCCKTLRPGWKSHKDGNPGIKNADYVLLNSSAVKDQIISLEKLSS